MSENNETVCLRHVTCTRLPESNRPNSFMRQTFYHRKEVTVSPLRTTIE